MASTSKPDHKKALLYMALLALQFGLQPILVRRYTPQNIVKSTVVLMQEVLKFAMALFMLNASSGSLGSLQTVLKGWTVKTWLTVAAVPAALYSIQNVASLTAYQNLDGVTYNVLNQTKTLSAAFCCWLVMGRRQSKTQVLSLLLLLLSALVVEGIVPCSLDWLVRFPTSMRSNISSFTRGEGFGFGRSLKEEAVLGTSELPSDDPTTESADATSAAAAAAAETGEFQWEARHFTHGVVPIMLASFISGLAGALSEKNLQSAGGGRNAYLFSMELCVASVLLFSASLFFSNDGQRIRADGFWIGWTPHTLLPIVTNSAGGILVGLVTKYAGSVRKGFALMFGILLSGVIQSIVEPEQTISQKHIVGGVLAATSLYLHSTHPAKATSSSTIKSKAKKE